MENQIMDAIKDEVGPPYETSPAVMTGLTYRPALKEVTGETRTLLVEWSAIPENDLARHVNNLRDKAYKEYPYACIGLFTFLDIDMPLFDQYDHVLDRVRGGDSFLDLGCCFAQEIRQLAFDGAPTAKVYGADVSEAFITFGYQLFRDRQKLDVSFYVADIFASESKLTTELTGKLDIIHASNFFHLWEWEKQIDAAKRVVQLLAPKPGSMLFGTHVASARARSLEFPSLNRSVFVQSLNTWKQLWGIVSKETGVDFDVQLHAGKFAEQDAFNWPESLESVRMFYTITRK